MIKIGHASYDENRKAHGGAAGDQTGGEVCTRLWYSSPWDTVLRCKDADKAEKMAKTMEAACANNNIGYDQYQRNSLLAQAKACAWDLSKIKEKCETDCSALVTVCAQCAGIDVAYISGNAPYTGIMKAQFLRTGFFEALTDKKYLTSDKYLKRGDILLRTSGHTAMALENGSLSGSVTVATGVGKIDSVREVQCWLNNNFASGLTLDGLYGTLTKKALTKALQKTLGVGADGVYGPVTAGAVKNLRRGSTGMLVKILQAFLICNGYTSAYLDGDFGSGTDKALQAYQRRMGLDVDGVAGKDTFEKLCK